MLSPWAGVVGPLALVAIRASGAPETRSAELLELAAVLVEPPGSAEPAALLAPPIRPSARRPADAAGPRADAPADPADAAPLTAWAPGLARALRGRTLVAHDASAVRPFVARGVEAALAEAPWLDTRDWVALAFPDARDLALDALTGPLLGRPAASGARGAALDLLAVLAEVAAQGPAGPRGRSAARALRRFVPESPWLGLVAPRSVGGAGAVRPPAGSPGAAPGPGDETFAAGEAEPAEEPPDESAQFVAIGESRERPVPFDADAIAAVLLDVERGRRHFPGYRVRHEQVELMRAFCRNLAGGGTLLLEGGTGVGKSLAYLAAAIPFAMTRAEAGERDPVVVSTRTKLLQDQLLENDIAAAARMLGHPGLRALSIKGRANYVCEKRLQDVLARGADGALLQEDRLAFAVLHGCARIRPGGEVGTLPAPLLARHPRLRELVRGAVARRAEQCTREECGHRRGCPFGRRRKALGRAHLVVANHDLLLRWPPDYPRFGHVIADEGHELAGVADDVYARSVRPEELMERIDEVFGAAGGGRGLLAGAGTRASAAEPGPGLLPRRQRLEARKTVGETRRALALDLASIGRAVAGHAGEYGEVELPAGADRLLPDAARTADVAAARLESLARLADELDARSEWTFDEAPGTPSGDGPTPVQRNAAALRESAAALRMAFGADAEDVVAHFGGLVSPYDRWTLALRAVSPASAFHREFMEARASFAAVSASLFVGGDAFAALGELELEERAAFGVDRLSVPSPFDYAAHMRVVALEGPVRPEALVAATADVVATLARRLGGRTLALFTSLRRLQAVAERLAAELEPLGITVLWPRRSSDDPAGLIRRFRGAPGGAVLLGSRTFWQGVDIPGDDLQAVVIEKLPFDVPTELRRRREERLRALGLNAFERYRLGKMLLHLKQMTGRLIRGEDDRGIVVVVDARPDRSYFARLGDAFPSGVEIRRAAVDTLLSIAAEVELSDAAGSQPGNAAGVQPGNATGARPGNAAGVQRGVALTPRDSQS